MLKSETRARANGLPGNLSKLKLVLASTWNFQFKFFMFVIKIHRIEMSKFNENGNIFQT